MNAINAVSLMALPLELIGKCVLGEDMRSIASPVAFISLPRRFLCPGEAILCVDPDNHASASPRPDPTTGFIY